MPSLFGLAPGGVCRAVSVAGNAVRSYRTFSPLPCEAPKSVAGRFVLCGTFPGVAPAGCYPAPHVDGARTFLSGSLSTLAGAAVRPTDVAVMGVRTAAVKPIALTRFPSFACGRLPLTPTLQERAFARPFPRRRRGEGARRRCGTTSSPRSSPRPAGSPAGRTGLHRRAVAHAVNLGGTEVLERGHHLHGALILAGHGMP